MNKKAHWENVFSTKKENEVSWYEKKPETSIQSIEKLNLPKNAKIIDVGGGDSYLIDSLLDLSYTNLYLLDISDKAIERIQKRLQANSDKVHFITSDIIQFIPKEKFDVWHDRASFHFLTDPVLINTYKKIATEGIKENGTLIIGTFATSGPLKCSGLPITQYTATTLKETFESDFKLIENHDIEHETPFGTIQNFIFCTFKKNAYVFKSI
ncbi:class I SAM-dependent methyltransferase [Flavobacterium columnare]|uniref:Class I SAM-dependent methyltransferase n=1 Tax=Flavobacterium columnare TaxID=996 RepID=A0AAI8GAR3_9FLAO|nr:class I SAM-dependent methyltransferase [Flavobacterium columnare]AMO19707.1 class I SAM-dependent methyltransferase [Flavobacterium columnare]AUX17640.1 SAM-dependent methyltransferase [Flavobacterium columnare]MEB3800493.1 class I SAM-dependent methyltransferase [Flavobacterium columnare]QOG56699.1 class I SAM-dependent methyltransferase [Flavobacterium columnare]QOG59424.1 class I SAM-dependent methyltransferase [Flavobacterium columnare]